jgi:putative acetyltransferase
MCQWQMLEFTFRRSGPTNLTLRLLSSCLTKLLRYCIQASTADRSNSRTLLASNVVILIARTTDGEAAGCCALFVKSDNTGELKRMIVDPRFRGRGVGVSLVQAVLGSAEKRGIKTIQLEVGTKNIEAQTLYRKMGFYHRDAFGDYKPTSISMFMERPTGRLNSQQAHRLAAFNRR